VHDRLWYLPRRFNNIKYGRSSWELCRIRHASTTRKDASPVRETTNGPNLASWPRAYTRARCVGHCGRERARGIDACARAGAPGPPLSLRTSMRLAGARYGGRGPSEKTKRQGARSVPFTTRRYVEENQSTRECSRRHRIHRHRRRRRRNPYKRDIARTFGRLVGRSVGQSVSQSVNAAACTRKSLPYRDNIFLPITTKVSPAAWLRTKKKKKNQILTTTQYCFVCHRRRRSESRPPI